MDNQTWVRELVKEIRELEALIAKAARCGEAEGRWGASMLKRLLRRRLHSLWHFQQAGNHGLH